MDEALEQAKELAKQALEERYGEVGQYGGAWDARDARRMFGHDGFVLVYILPIAGRKFVAIGANSSEMWLEKIF